MGDSIMKKSIRNRALGNVDRLITCEYKNERWECGGGHFAIKYPIFEGYRTRKGQTVLEPVVSLDPILRDTPFMKPVTDIDASGDYVRAGEVALNKDYYELVRDIYPDAEIRTDGGKLSQAIFYEDGAPVAVIMPIKI